ncbi:MAG: exodeoxyribonuclease V subunit beta [Deltaproteobacteria bacterium]|nr:exodeoxyribonuclease V subunit beta [Deltaproteobacteria bacterium]
MSIPAGYGRAATALDPLAVPLNGTVLIEASAGTGKTHTITTLFVRLLLERELNVEQILVVTYTNAATAELRTRIRCRVNDVLAAFDGMPIDDEALTKLVAARQSAGQREPDRLRLLSALHSFDQAAIFTIHGFCQRMLQEHAFESGVAFQTDLITDQRPLIEQVVRDFWVRELHAAPYPLVVFVQQDAKRLQRLDHLATLATAHPEMPFLPEASEVAAVNDDELVAICDDKQRDDALQARWLRMQLDCPDYTRRELRRRKEEAHQQSFDDLLQRLVEALRAPSGDDLARRIRQRLGAALIDEFQDTDPLQYEIFRRIYHGAPESALFLIGDPKQAIYAFRGADVFAYLEAKGDAPVQHTLLTNYRSDPKLVEGVNALFRDVPVPFVFDDIPFHEVAAAPQAVDQLEGGGPPMEILFVPRDADTGARGRSKGWTQLAPRVAADILRKLRSPVTLQGRGLAPGDFAVLCRKNKQALEMQEALRALNLPTVLQGDSSVFDTSEAAEVGRILRAIAEPSDNAAVRAALATTLLGASASDLYALQTDEHGWDAWLRRFQEWNQLWNRRGFIACFRGMMDRQEVVPRLLGLRDGERRVTNVLHLAELLHAASVDDHRGPAALVHWLAQMRTDDTARATMAAEAVQIRLESDEAAIKLVTIHKSKGLQYPLVYCPYLWDGRLMHESEEKMPRFHDRDDRNRLKLDLGSSLKQEHKAIAQREALAESLRLLYVALTRAQHSCTVVWGGFNECDTSALGYLLHSDRSRPDPAAVARRRIKDFLHSKSDDGMRADLARLASASQGTIAVRDLAAEAVAPWISDDSVQGTLLCRRTQRTLALRWRTASFSSLTRSSGSVSRPAAEGIDHDAGSDMPEGTVSAGDIPIVLHDFPAGARSGQILHRIFEQFDFRQSEDVLRRQVLLSLEEGGVDGRWVESVTAAVTDVLDTPLGAPRLRLRDVPAEKRLNELEFLFSVAVDEHDAGPSGDQLGLFAPQTSGVALTPKSLAKAFARHARLPFAPEYANRLAQVEFTALAGFLKGYIDLIFEHEGLWYVVDYKSNRLGPTPHAYTPQRLPAVMMSHHYLLQYHLYLVALHRHLKRRLPGYDYERHCGGVYYLFLRGMAPRYAPGNGVYFDRPPRKLIEQLSHLFDAGAEPR